MLGPSNFGAQAMLLPSRRRLRSIMCIARDITLFFMRLEDTAVPAYLTPGEQESEYRFFSRTLNLTPWRRKPMMTTATPNAYDTTTERVLFVAFERSEKTWTLNL
jgi:hypothetical protein